MRVILVTVVLISAVAKVNCHGGLAVPFMWTDETGHGDSQTRFGSNGCTSKALDKITKEKAQSLTPADNAGSFGKFIRRLSSPNCYFLFLNDFESWKSDGGDQRLTDTYGQNIPRMPREMFYQTSDSPLARYSHLAARADFCHNLDLTTTKGLNTYKSHFNCKNPWHRPGFAKIVSSCGISGGLQGAYGNSKDIIKDLYPYGQPAETYSYPNALTTQWKRGKKAKVVWNVHANHAGGYSYRLCKVPSQGIVGLTEECFQQTPLAFKGKDQWVRAEGQKKWTKKRAMQTTVGTWPQGSMWRKNHYFTYGTCMEHVDCTKKEELADKDCGRCRGQIKDEVKVPANLAPGAYVLSWRWDAEGSGQIWSGCANIDIA